LPSPLGNKLNQKAAERRIGCILAPIRGNTVDPPISGTSNFNINSFLGYFFKASSCL